MVLSPRRRARREPGSSASRVRHDGHFSLAAIVIPSLPSSCSICCTHNGAFVIRRGRVDAIVRVQRSYQEE